ncbi:MAG: hydrogenase expression/formation protein HypE [Bacteroidaceae bacterium]|nr:hydrogenase expression/formation protein HypE [Bacteroidaceae bacterium]
MIKTNPTQICPLPITDYEQIMLAHGGGGKLTQRMIEQLFFPAFNNEYLGQEHDGAVIPVREGRLAVTTDSFVVNPIIFPGGNIGDLAINGTVNDLACCGAVPMYLTASFILEEGFSMADLKRIVDTMSIAARKAGVKIVTGDTKVVEKGKGDGIYINTSGIGIVPDGIDISPMNAVPGDVVIVSGLIGQHGITVLSTRDSLGFETEIKSDTAPLNGMISDLLAAVPEVHVLRDPTRGGVSATLNEIARKAQVTIEIDEALLPVGKQVSAACDLLGLDPLCVANEGIVLVFVPESQSEKAIEVLRNNIWGRNAAVVGRVSAKGHGTVTLKTLYGGCRIVDVISGEQLPRIC